MRTTRSSPRDSGRRTDDLPSGGGRPTGVAVGRLERDYWDWGRALRRIAWLYCGPRRHQSRRPSAAARESVPVDGGSALSHGRRYRRVRGRSGMADSGYQGARIVQEMHTGQGESLSPRCIDNYGQSKREGTGREPGMHARIYVCRLNKQVLADRYVGQWACFEGKRGQKPITVPLPGCRI